MTSIDIKDLIENKLNFLQQTKLIETFHIQESVGPSGRNVFQMAFNKDLLSDENVNKSYYVEIFINNSLVFSECFAPITDQNNISMDNITEEIKLLVYKEILHHIVTLGITSNFEMIKNLNNWEFDTE